MGDARIQPNFKSIAALHSESAKGSLDPTSRAERGEEEQAPEGGAADGRETPTISMYQDPRDELDLERHQRGGIGSRQARG